MSLHGIHTIDTAFQRDHFDAAYLIVEDGRGAFVDCGTNHSVPHLLAAVQQAGITPADIDLLIVTHVHLDHAGGAGLLMQQLPNATLVAHPRAAPHLIDPEKLIAGATAVYGEEEMQRSYGTLQPMPEARVRVVEDGYALLEAGDTRIALLARATTAPPSDRFSMAFEVDDVPKLCARLEEAGSPLSHPARDPEGLREVNTLDPDGNRVRLFSWPNR